MRGLVELVERSGVLVVLETATIGKISKNETYAHNFSSTRQQGGGKTHEVIAHFPDLSMVDPVLFLALGCLRRRISVLDIIIDFGHLVPDLRCPRSACGVPLTSSTQRRTEQARTS